jgi:hypothetical protein
VIFELLSFTNICVILFAIIPISSLHPTSGPFLDGDRS